MNGALKRNELGYHEVVEKPTNAELENYYAEKYYQSPTGQYQQEYSKKELDYFRNKALVCMETMQSSGYQPETLYEIGCGEGFFADQFFKKGVKLTLNDFSSAGLEKFHPHLIPYLDKGDVQLHIEDFAAEGNTFDLISMDNVLEHVVDPDKLMASVKQIMSNRSVLRITVPNDFSAFQEMLLEEGMATRTWVCLPDHLTYFNSTNLSLFCEKKGFKVLSVQCDFPIELFLTNPHSHYYNDRSLGKAAHHSRIACTNYMIERSVKAFIKMAEGAAELEYGRDTTIYLTLDN